MDNAQLVIGLWNVEWASINSKKGRYLAPRIASLSTELLCLTEGYADLFPNSGHTITSDGDYGYPAHPNRRKVLLWSRSPWSQVDALGSCNMPAGRFISGITETSLGAVRVIGDCIPWWEAHVRTGQRNRQQWEDHMTYLREIAPILRSCDASIPTVILGDFNQRVPCQRQPQVVFQALMDAIGPDFDIVTSGEIANAPDYSIDHVAISRQLRHVGIHFVSNLNEVGEEMSDHFGLQIVLAAAP